MANNYKQFLELREKYPNFIFSGYDISDSGNSLSISYNFSIPNLAQFNPKWEIAKLSSSSITSLDERLHQLIFSLGMVELVSYWKITCSPNVEINCGFLSESQVSWWKKLYKNGLGEFFYTNGIEVDDSFITIVTNSDNSLPQTNSRITDECIRSAGVNLTEGKICSNNPKKNIISCDNKKVLIPIGGGKDSIVTIELLENLADRFGYIINPRKATLDSAAVSSIPNIITANRTLDANMIELNKKGFLNGHTPFSALVAFSSVIAAYIHDIEFVALSNESSANEPTVLGSDVNHQYSKSFEFESDFIEYEAEYIMSGVKYFSLLRPLHEISIAKIFSRLKKYHKIFRSCNVGSKQDIWCAKCPKCLFVYIILAPFLSNQEMIDIFGRNMLDDIELETIFKELIGLLPEKPFECVGSCDEVNAALQELVRQNKLDTTLINIYKTLNIPKKQDIMEMCSNYNLENYVPKQFAKKIKDEIGAN